jgi:gluconolactonase
MQYEVKKDGSLNKGTILFDASTLEEEGGPDGMKVDEKGNIYATGPGGILIISPSGKHLGTIKFPEQPSNCAFGGPDMKTLYVTARKGLYRVKLKTAGRN